MKVAGSRVLITGASSGIGAATARAMAGAGALPLVAGRDHARLAAVAAGTGGRALPGDLRTGVRELAAAAGPVDILVNNAGTGWAGAFAEMPDEVLQDLIEVNVTVPIRLTRLLLPAMIEAGRGHVVFVASIAGALGVRREAVYSATKAALLGFAEALRQEVAGTGGGTGAGNRKGRGGGIGVSVLLPGVVDTPFFERRGTPYARRWPVKISPERVARAVVAAVERDRPESYVPGWLWFPARLRGAVPGPYRALARRFG